MNRSTVYPRDRLAVALDVPDLASARALVGMLRAHAGWFKVGLELYASAGPDAVKAVVDAGSKAFADLKLHDIPNTVKGAVRSLAAAGASLCTVHASGGAAMVRAAVEAQVPLDSSGHPRPLGEGRGEGPPSPGLRVLAVTALTSLDDAAIAEIGMTGGAAGTVERLLRLAISAGAHGAVMSPRECASARRIVPPDFVIVTPGIRAPGDAQGDQARTASPAEAIAAGSDLLVVGRPITRAKDPAGRAQEILDDIAHGMLERIR
ncbi:MAG: orotidine-5'-phosphate decarboxylase [Deltaproteobacteria bacterium]|nr:orotidine-5'-phosphate decarboxylase [Deltaproteobacteria bacterium]